MSEVGRRAAPSRPAAGAWRPVVRFGALALAVVAIALPVRATAGLFAAPGAARMPELLTGVWILKAVLLLHAAIAGVLIAVGRIDKAGAPLASAAAPAEPARRIDLTLLGLLLAIGAALRLRALSAGLWYDEIQTMVTYVRLPAAEIVSTFSNQNQHMLYSLLARAAFVLFGDSGASLRLPAALFGVASLGALYWLGTLVTSRREALLATAVMTVSYHHVWFSQNARGYTGLLFFTLVGTGLFVRLLTRPRGGWPLAIGYAATMALAHYTHVTAVFVTAAHGLVWLVLAWQRRRDAKTPAVWVPGAALALAGTFTALIYALVLPQFIEALTAPATSGVTTRWQNPLWFAAEMIRGLTSGIPGGWLGLIGGGLVAIIGLVSYWRRSRMVATLMVLPVAIAGAALVATSHNLWPRFFFFGAGFAILIAVRGVFESLRLVLPRAAEARAPAIATAALALLALASALTVPRAWLPKQDYGGALAYVAAQRTGSDAIVALDMAGAAYAAWPDPGWLKPSSVDELGGIERSHDRTWVVYTFPTRLSAVQPDVWRRLQDEYRTAARFPGTIGEGTIYVMVKP